MVTRPPPVCGVFNQIGADRIEVNITDQLQEIGIFLAKNRLISPLKQVPHAVVA
jgi:hypothetical protein